MAEEEASCSHQVDLAASVGANFVQENQITVIPIKTTIYDDTDVGTKLEDLFKPINEIENDAAENASFEIVNAGSGSDIRATKSQGGEIDVFTHLFDDEQAKQVLE